MKSIILAFLISATVFGQRPVQLVFDSIRAEKPEQHSRKFRLFYHISNTADKPVSFFLNTKSIVPVVSSSMSYAPHYKLYKDGKSVDVSGVFTSAEQMWASREAYERYMDSIKKAEPDIAAMKKNQSDRIMASLVRLGPRESKSCSILLRWDLERYQRQDENEYFLDADSAYTLELSMHLLLSELETRLEKAAYDKVLSDKTMITGWFTSNALPIDLSGK